VRRILPAVGVAEKVEAQRVQPLGAAVLALPCARQRKTQELRDKFIKVVKEQTMCGGKGVPRAAATRCQTR
jgi:hypothetical protein